MKLNFNKFTTTVSRINFIKRIITVTIAAAREGVDVLDFEADVCTKKLEPNFAQKS